MIADSEIQERFPDFEEKYNRKIKQMQNKVADLQKDIKMLEQHILATKDVRWEIVKTNLRLQLEVVQELLDD